MLTKKQSGVILIITVLTIVVVFFSLLFHQNAASMQTDATQRTASNKTPQPDETIILKPIETVDASEYKQITQQQSEPLVNEALTVHEEDPSISGAKEAPLPQPPEVLTDSPSDSGNTEPDGSSINEADNDTPPPVEGENVAITDQELTCFLSVRCDTLLTKLDVMNQEKRELVPDDGIIFGKTEVVFYDGESVFNVLHREMKKNRIHLEFVNTPLYNSAYIEGINNLYEFDCGDLSGWMYKVNGYFPGYGCSRYLLSGGDTIEWVYTCDLGRDVGDVYSSVGGMTN